MEKITVYAFTAYDIGSDTDDPRPVKATREKIKTLAGAVILQASAEEVDASLLDGQGYYRAPRKTPWSDGTNADIGRGRPAYLGAGR